MMKPRMNIPTDRQRLRFGSLSGRESVRQHEQILAATDAHHAAAPVKQNWLSLGTLIDRSCE